MLERLKSLKNHQGFMKYFKNTLWFFGKKVFIMVIYIFNAFKVDDIDYEDTTRFLNSFNFLEDLV